jgi:hypothetical protein
MQSLIALRGHGRSDAYETWLMHDFDVQNTALWEGSIGMDSSYRPLLRPA